MEYMGETAPTQNLILCCECGTHIEPNAANMCVACLRTHVDITEGIPKQGALHFCRNCERYQQPPSAWVKASLESRELLALCLKKIKGVSKVRLVDAGFLWTEPHSKRLKVKLTIEKEVLNGAVLQQTFVVEFVVNNQMCEDCHRVEAKDFWKACVQIRQKTSHKKTMFYLEQLILKHRAHAKTSGIKQMSDGLDFFYPHKQEARKMIDFLQAVVPCRYQTAQELISHDIHSNTYNYKSTFSAEIVPICKDNIVCLPKKLALQLGNIGQICIVYRVTQNIHIIDSNTLQIAEVSGAAYWRSPFNALSHPKQLVEYMVMQVDIIFDKRHVAGKGQDSQKHVLADVWVVKLSEMGTSDQQYHCRTHLGHLLNYGDIALGFDMRTANVNDHHFNQMNTESLSDVILVKKMYADSKKRQKRRKWKLHHLSEFSKQETASLDRDYNDFLEDLEEDPAYRQHINIYKNAEKFAVQSDDTTDDEMPKISLAEMLDDLHISQDATGEAGADMVE